MSRQTRHESVVDYDAEGGRETLEGGAKRLLNHEPPDALMGRRLHAQIRARHEAAACSLTPTRDGFTLVFEDLQRAITPGQAAVIFDEENETVVAGGWIAGN